jgi:3D (Asp-Asp-Asp) domain-containing protein
VPRDSSVAVTSKDEPLLLTVAATMLLTSMATQHSPATRTQAPAQPCEQYRITGYTVLDFPGITADGTSTQGAIARGEHIVAASYNLPLGSYVFIEGLGVHRVADRGHLDARHLDVLVATYAQAYALTGYRKACPMLPDADDDY